MRNILKTSLALTLTLVCLNASATTQELTSCAQLQAPKTVLLVHTSWCHYCKDFMPKYEAVSNLPEMSEYTFYTKQADDEDSICGVQMRGYPATFTNNMQSKLLGDYDKETLIDFIQGKE